MQGRGQSGAAGKVASECMLACGTCPSHAMQAAGCTAGKGLLTLVWLLGRAVLPHVVVVQPRLPLPHLLLTEVAALRLQAAWQFERRHAEGIVRRPQSAGSSKRPSDGAPVPPPLLRAGTTAGRGCAGGFGMRWEHAAGAWRGTAVSGNPPSLHSLHTFHLAPSAAAAARTGSCMRAAGCAPRPPACPRPAAPPAA